MVREREERDQGSVRELDSAILFFLVPFSLSVRGLVLDSSRFLKDSMVNGSITLPYLRGQEKKGGAERVKESNSGREAALEAERKR